MNAATDGTLLRVEHRGDALLLRFPGEREVLSSAPLGGGLVRARQVLNLHVDDQPGQAPEEPPEHTLVRCCAQLGLTGTTVGMMTGASLGSMREVQVHEGGVRVCCVVTLGLSNAKRAGESAEWRRHTPPAPPPGTINCVVSTDARLTGAALCEAVMVATEAKAATLAERGVRSRTGPGIATGTGTDVIAIVNGEHGPRIRYCGKHVLMGEMIARSVMCAIGRSLDGFAGDAPLRRESS